MRELIGLVRSEPGLDGDGVERAMRRLNKGRERRDITKKGLVSFYLSQRESRSDAYMSWDVDEELHRRLVELLRSKPGRTASGVATVSVLMKPWPCGGRCAYCPNDIRMPKSYLADEPACQRAELARFDPYLQVVRRLQALAGMGHNIDKVELIVLGGTFDDYTQEYREWFIQQLFEALDDYSDGSSEEASWSRERYYMDLLGAHSPSRDKRMAERIQSEIDDGRTDYNTAIALNPYWPDGEAPVLEALECKRTLAEEHALNEVSACRCVGLVIETRPECITEESLLEKRRLGCTKVQMGIQSLDSAILEKSCRAARIEDIARAFELLREHGFKSHVHLMQNLPGATLESDAADFEALVSDVRFKPDEVKLYPCALVESAQMRSLFEGGDWRGYDTEDLIVLLANMVAKSPRHMRVSRMIRDIPSGDIVAGNKITNLRQLVESRLHGNGTPVKEMRMREVRTGSVDGRDLEMMETRYETSNSCEVFIEHVASDDTLAGFLRLSLPLDPAKDAMIREVHVYGKVARIGEEANGAQHMGLGKGLVDCALRIAREDGREHAKVISAVGTRVYYRSLGFEDDGLYQRICTLAR